MTDEMKPERLTVEIAPDLSSAEITFLPASGASGTLTVSPDQLLSLIQAFGNVHAHMVANIPPPPIAGANLNVSLNTVWYTAPHALSERSLLAFQHAAFGPLGFLLTKPDIEMLVTLLNQQLQIQPQSATDKPN